VSPLKEFTHIITWKWGFYGIREDFTDARVQQNNLSQFICEEETLSMPTTLQRDKLPRIRGKKILTADVFKVA
jgi:hypothetical protein